MRRRLAPPATVAGDGSTMPALRTMEGSEPPAGEAWRLHLLGVPRLARGAAATPVRLSAKDAALLALVALDGPVASDHAAALIWPAVDRRKADTNLRQRLFRMRRDFGANLVVPGAQLVLVPAVDTDIESTLALIAEDERAGRDELLGDLDFDGLPDLANWVRQARARWHEQRDAALAAAAARCESVGAVSRGLVYAQRVLDSEPLSEHAQRRLMRLHYLRGDFSAAIAAFEVFEQRLKDELGARPSAETIELLRTIEGSATALPVRRAVVPASLLRPPRMVGRGADLAALARAWAERRAFLLIGEAGIGKTRLLHDLAADGDGVLGVQARPGDAGIAYAVLARLLRAVLALHSVALADPRREALAPVLPELGASMPLAGEAQRLLLYRAVDATLGDAAGLGLRAVIVDDLHFADDASVEILQSLTQSDTLRALSWGFAQRPADAGSATAALRAALEEARQLATVTLRPLNLAQVSELIESLALPDLDAQRLAPALLKHTGGNPMFALETLKDLLLSGAPATAERLPNPTTVAALVERRLAQLSPAALKLARVAALAGTSFTAALAAAVLDLHPLDIAEPWRELEAAQVIRDDAFAHDLIFEATRASVPEPIARLLHRRIAEQLQAGDALPASIAPHWAGAQDWARAAAAHVRAARQAQGASQRGHEVEHWQQARACFDRAGDSDGSFDARCESIQALIVVHGVANADAVIDALLVDARTDRQRVAALTARASAALMAADHQAGIAAALEAGRLARKFESPWPWFEAERLHAVGLAQSGRAVEGLAVIEPFRERVEQDGTAEHKGRFWADYAYVLNAARRLRDTAAALGRAIENARALGDLAELATLTSNLATVKGNLGHVDEALDLAQRALALQVQLGTTDGPGGGVVETYVGLYCGMAGRYRESIDHFDAALDRFRRDGQTTWIAVASNHKAQTLSELGQWARARKTLDYEAPPVPSVRARRATVAARIDRALGHPDASALHGALELLGAGGDHLVRMHALLEQAASLEPDEALARFDEVLRLAGELEFAGVSMKAGLLRAQRLHRDHRSAAAAAALRDLLPRMASMQPADMYLPDAWWIAVQVFDACGASDDAMAALAQGTRWIRQVALPNVPAAFRDSFLNRNPTNLALLAAAGRRLA
jgi:DNA-binding SARP family transcriptional activator/tetratricopeptide (TPR) repeat protein